MDGGLRLHRRSLPGEIGRVINDVIRPRRLVSREVSPEGLRGGCRHHSVEPASSDDPQWQLASVSLQRRPAQCGKAALGPVHAHDDRRVLVHALPPVTMIPERLGPWVESIPPWPQRLVSGDRLRGDSSRRRRIAQISDGLGECRDTPLFEHLAHHLEVDTDLRAPAGNPVCFADALIDTSSSTRILIRCAPSASGEVVVLPRSS